MPFLTPLFWLYKASEPLSVRPIQKSTLLPPGFLYLLYAAFSHLEHTPPSDILCTYLCNLFIVFFPPPQTKRLRSMKAGTVSALGLAQGGHLLNTCWVNEWIGEWTVSGMKCDSFCSTPIYFQMAPSYSMNEAQCLVVYCLLVEYVVGCKWQKSHVLPGCNEDYEEEVGELYLSACLFWFFTSSGLHAFLNTLRWNNPNR